MSMEANGGGSPARIGFDADALEAFYRSHINTVRRFVAARVSDPHLAADLTADIFLAAIDASDTYDPKRGSPAAWLVGVARNVIAAEFRSDARRRQLHGRLAGRRLLDSDSEARIEERLDAERHKRALYAALTTLSDSDRALIEMIAIDELPVADAAVALGIKTGTARVRLHRLRRSLQNTLLQPPSITTAGAAS